MSKAKRPVIMLAFHFYGLFRKISKNIFLIFIEKIGDDCARIKFKNIIFNGQ